MVAASTEDRTLQLRSQRTPPPAELPLRLPLLLQLAAMKVPLWSVSLPTVVRRRQLAHLRQQRRKELGNIVDGGTLGLSMSLSAAADRTGVESLMGTLASSSGPQRTTGLGVTFLSQASVMRKASSLLCGLC
ncbi:hypothetical protein Q4I30_004152 [Leishmania utingensis]|uniref:Uncharacterized protein n=1 Tax=Leishmania utingensis TaxID=653362 RepID=A0AAW3AFD7_9TRYP